MDAPDPTWRPLTRDDVVALAALRNLAEDVDGTHQPMDAAQLAEAFDQPRFDPDRDTVSVWDGDRLLASGVVGVREELVDGRALVALDGVVHPDHRVRGLGAALLRAQERLGADLAARRFRNHSDVPADDWAHWTGSRASRQDQSAVVVEDGRVLSYALAGEFEPGVLHVTMVGTRREARGRGLGRQVLQRHLREAAAAGYAVSELEVDDDSLTGANRLYESVGYRALRTISRYVKDVGDAG